MGRSPIDHAGFYKHCVPTGRCSSDHFFSTNMASLQDAVIPPHTVYKHGVPTGRSSHDLSMWVACEYLLSILFTPIGDQRTDPVPEGPNVCSRTVKVITRPVGILFTPIVINAQTRSQRDQMFDRTWPTDWGNITTCPQSNMASLRDAPPTITQDSTNIASLRDAAPRITFFLQTWRPYRTRSSPRTRCLQTWRPYRRLVPRSKYVGRVRISAIDLINSNRDQRPDPVPQRPNVRQDM